jgi:murein DD-endopeptidase MepM/ murein hydrolase activator NlpD
MNLLRFLTAGLAAGVLAISALTPAAAAASAPRPSSTSEAALTSGIAPEADGWEWPLSPRPAVARPFDPPAKPWLTGHRGVDLAASSVGSEVLSPAAGTVSFVGVVVDRPVITVDHGNGLRSSFEPVRSHLVRGTPVRRGEVIGVLERGHCAEAMCLHWGVRRGDEYLDPLPFVSDRRPSILLPLE